MLLDTGCTTTLVASKVFDRIPVDLKPELKPSTLSVELADGSKKRVKGLADVFIELEGQILPYQVLITDVLDDVLLGIDFIRDHGIS